jgi:type II secretory pathway component PulC
MLTLIANLILVGTIVSTKTSYATFQIADRGREVHHTDDEYYAGADYDPPPTVTAEEGSTFHGWTVVKVEPRRALVSDGKRRFWLEAGDSPETPEPSPAAPEVERHDDEVTLSTALRNDIAGPGLAKVMMQAAATLVPGVGFRLTDIDPGSIFDQVGLNDGDIVMEIDGVALSDPLTAVTALRSAAGEDYFTVKVQSTTGLHLVNVSIR